MRPTIEVFDESALEAIKRDHDDLRRRVEELQQQVAGPSAASGQVQQIIGKATGDAGTVTGTYKINIHHGPYRNAADDADGEFAAYLVEAKPWADDAFAPVGGTKVMLWQTPFGLWYFVALAVNQVVQVYHNETAGKCVQANGEGYHPGRLRDWAGGTATSGDAIWLKIIDGDSSQTTREQKEFLGARFAGNVDGDGAGDERPLYIVAQGDLVFKAKADAAITAGSSGTVSIWTGGSDSGINVTAYLNWTHGSEDISSGKELRIKWFADESKWIIVGADCE